MTFSGGADGAKEKDYDNNILLCCWISTLKALCHTHLRDIIIVTCLITCTSLAYHLKVKLYTLFETLMSVPNS